MSRLPTNLRECVQCLEQDDARSRHYRSERLQLLIIEYGSERAHQVFVGGLVGLRSFNEARLAYLNGLFLACIVLCQICLEHSLASLLYMEGREEARKMSYSMLLREALKTGHISEEEFRLFDRIRKYRNPYVHFHAPRDEDWLPERAVRSNIPEDELVVQDAEEAIVALLHFFQHAPFTAP